jgi:hypothetical protein
VHRKPRRQAYGWQCQLARSRPPQAGPRCPDSALPARLGFVSEKNPSLKLDPPASRRGDAWVCFCLRTWSYEIKGSSPLFLPLPSQRLFFSFYTPTNSSAIALRSIAVLRFPPANTSRFFTALNEVSSTSPFI